jgi:hypothetical protein
MMAPPIAAPARTATTGGDDRFPHHLVQSALFAAASIAAWAPVETHPLTAVALATVVLALLPWAWRRSGLSAAWWLLTFSAAIAILVASGLSGWDPARSVGRIGLVAAVVSCVWLASRSRPPGSLPVLFAIVFAGLAGWGLWQTVVGLDIPASGLDELSGTARAYAEERIASRRAFASLPVPGHLAVLLATALPLLVTRIRRTAVGVAAGAAAALAAAGLLATRSPIGVGLALTATVVVLLRHHRRSAIAAAALMAVLMAGVVAVRPDVVRLEPVALRLDNWRTAVWLWSTAPLSGAGVASFAQATQNAPLDVGNRPAHAHSLPLEALAELGPVGFLVALALAVILVGIVIRLWPVQPGLAVAVAVVPAHNLVDYSLFVSAVAVPWAVLFGWALAHLRAPDDSRRAARGRAFAVAAASAALAVTSFHATSVVTERAAAAQPTPAERFEGATQAIRLAPWRVRPQFLLASAALEWGDREAIDEAWRQLDRRRWLRPRSAALAERRARLALARGDASVAVSEVWAAVEHGSSNERRDRLLDDLVAELDRRGDGARN